MQQQQSDKQFVTGYADGSFLEDQCLGGAGVYFGPDDKRNFWSPLTKDFGSIVSAERAEMFAALLLVKLVLTHLPPDSPVPRIVIKQDCLNAVKKLQAIPCYDRPSAEVLFDPLLTEWWKANQYAEVHFEYVRAHQERALAEAEGWLSDWYGNHEADLLAKRGSAIVDNKKFRYSPFRISYAGRRCHRQSHLMQEERQKQIGALELRLQAIEAKPAQERWAHLAAMDASDIEDFWAFQHFRDRLVRAHDPMRPIFWQQS